MKYKRMSPSFHCDDLNDAPSLETYLQVLFLFLAHDIPRRLQFPVTIMLELEQDLFDAQIIATIEGESRDGQT